MGNRAVITLDNGGIFNPDDIGVYVHWDGGEATVRAVLLCCKLIGFRSPTEDPSYGFARFIQVFSNYISYNGSLLSIGVEKNRKLDTNNGNNGVYLIKDWDIINRITEDPPDEAPSELEVFTILQEVNAAQPDRIRIKDLDEYLTIKERGDKWPANVFTPSFTDFLSAQK